MLTRDSEEFKVIKSNIDDIVAKLETGQSGFGVALARIHAGMAKTPETISILTDDEIKTIVQGYKKESVMQIKTAAPTTSKKKLSEYTADDI